MRASALIPTRRDSQRRVPLRVPRGAADVGRLLRDRALRAAVHGEDPRLLGAQGRGRDAADARHVRDRLVLRRARSTSDWARSRRSRSGAARAHRRAVPALAGRRRLELRRADRRPGGDRDRGRASSTPRSRPPGSPRSIPPAPSLAGGLIYMFQIAGGAIGLGITTTIFTLTLRERARRQGRRRRNPPDRSPGRASCTGCSPAPTPATAALHQLSSSAQTRITAIVRESFATGIQAGFRFVTDRRGARLPDLAVLRRRPAARPPRPEPEQRAGRERPRLGAAARARARGARPAPRSTPTRARRARSRAGRA